MYYSSWVSAVLFWLILGPFFVVFVVWFCVPDSLFATVTHLLDLALEALRPHPKGSLLSFTSKLFWITLSRS